MDDKVIRLPTARRRRVKNPQLVEPELVIDWESLVPERPDAPRAARRPWFSNRWHHLRLETRDEHGTALVPVPTLRRRRI